MEPTSSRFRHISVPLSSVLYVTGGLIHDLSLPLLLFDFLYIKGFICSPQVSTDFTTDKITIKRSCEYGGTWHGMMCYGAVGTRMILEYLSVTLMGVINAPLPLY